MAYIPTELMLVRGLPSSVSLGNPNVTDLAPVSLDLINGVFTILDENGNSTWVPNMPPLKGGGIWVDSPLIDGRDLVLNSKENVEESITLVPAQNNSSALQRSQALSDLRIMADAASDFWAQRAPQPVYLKFTAPGTPGPQYALVYTIEVDDESDGLSVEATGNVTITLEREPAWRPLPPGANPKLWTFERRSLNPYSQAGVPPAGQYNYTNLSLTAAGGAANYQQLVEANIYGQEEIGTSNVNYIDIPATSLPGDAPVAVEIFANPPTGGGSLLVARSTIRDLYPANNNNSATQKMRATFAAGDATQQSPAGLTTSKQVDATNGLFSNGSTVTRYIGRHVWVAAGSTITWTHAWTRALQHYNRKFMVFARLRVTAGNAGNITLNASLHDYVNAILSSTPVRNLNGVTNLWRTFYLGTLDGSAARGRANDGTGMLLDSLTLRLNTGKSNDAAVATMEVADLTLMPLDEPNVRINQNTTGMTTLSNVIIDSSGYLGFERIPLAIYMNSIPAIPIGQPIFLRPGVANRLYFMVVNPGSVNHVPGVAVSYPVSVNVMPRWYGLRDV